MIQGIHWFHKELQGGLDQLFDQQLDQHIAEEYPDDPADAGKGLWRGDGKLEERKSPSHQKADQ